MVNSRKEGNNMMYLVQKENNELTLDEHIIVDLLNQHKYQFEWQLKSLVDIEKMSKEQLEYVVPIGTIQFVTKVLNKGHGFIKENPIEIPKYLRTDKYLKRDYKIVKGSDLPRTGYCFIKNASTLKQFSYLGQLDYFLFDEMFYNRGQEDTAKCNDYTLKICNDDLFVVSSNFNPQAEYRVYVVNHEIINIGNYDGNICEFPPDFQLIKDAVSEIRDHEEWLKSYTLDIMVNKTGTAIIEIHNLTSCGLYATVFGSKLLYGYKQGIDYLLNDNHLLEV